ncbi:STAS domain-containing protein [Streptomyces althioticus]|uniref:Anti-sigma factor antagonist n=1 Tax=Streptomyces griseorubens TaxID=66897 RepID=A0ABR4TAP9_9ACTN|nr:MULTISPECIES: STAS domain-containing protein [Actinomycetes]MCC9690288.1 STAS domain-containing protein [Streptomyces sp. MNU103]WTC27061.1 STAS domain-containing protein [Streptomyces althioticus]GGT35869.1 anti-sigma factor antagonist [Streptomyces matensis]KEG44340.1 anti-sigma factor antagonist [Streptomyces griseorubens]MBM4832742.1 STAS domain-containing protein [Actinospica acidiphila]
MSVPDETFTVTHRPHAEGPYVLEVAGELDHHTAPLLTEAVNEAPFGPYGVVLDLSGLTFCDSSGITVFVTAHRRSREKGSQLSLAGVAPAQMRVLRMVGLDEVFTFHAGVEDAFRAARPPS